MSDTTVSKGDQTVMGGINERGRLTKLGFVSHHRPNRTGFGTDVVATFTAAMFVVVQP